METTFPEKNLATNKSAKTRRSYWKVFLLIILVFFFANLIFQAFRFVGALQKPFPSLEGGFANEKRLNLKQRSNLLILSYNSATRTLSQEWLVSYEASSKEVYFLKIPGLAAMDKSEKSLEEVFTESFDLNFWLTANMIGVPLDGYLAFKDIDPIAEEDFLREKREIFSFGFFLNFLSRKNWLDQHLSTNLSTGELISISRIFKAASSDQVNFLDLSEHVEKGVADLEKIDEDISSLLADSQIAQENSLVKIINGSGVAGLGNNFKRLVTNLGGRSLMVESENEKETKVLATDENNQLAKKIASFLAVDLSKVNQGSEAEVKIVLGSDLASKLGLIGLNK